MTTTAPTNEIPDEVKRWNMVYPLYLDSTRAATKGRRIRKELGVAHPTGQQLFKACKELQLTDIVFPEPNKKHTRDQLNPGRIRIKCTDDNGEFNCAGTYKSRRELYTALAKKIAEIQEQEEKEKEAKKNTLKAKQKQKKGNSKTSAVRTFGDKKKKKKKR